MFAELERTRRRQARRGHRRDQPRDRRPRHADLPAHRRGDAGGGRRPGATRSTRANRGRDGVPRSASPTSTSRRFGVEIDPETEVIPAIGAKECIYNLCFAFLDPGDVALASDPGYPVYTGGPILAGAEAELLPLVPELGFAPDLDAIDAERARARAADLPQLPQQPDRRDRPRRASSSGSSSSPASTRSSSSTTTPTRRRPTTATSRRASSRRRAPRRSASRSSRSRRAST